MLFSFFIFFFFFSSRRRHTRWNCDWSSDVCSSDLDGKLTLLKRRGISERNGFKPSSIDLDDGQIVVGRLADDLRGIGRAGRELHEIGRASCRERGVDLGGRRVSKKKRESREAEGAV